MFLCRRYKITQVARSRDGGVTGSVKYKGQDVIAELIIDSSLVKCAVSGQYHGKPAHAARAEVLKQFNYVIDMMPEFEGKKQLEHRQFNELQIERGRIASPMEHFKYLILSLFGADGAGLLETKQFKKLCEKPG